jgi:hypothetical protein
VAMLVFVNVEVEVGSCGKYIPLSFERSFSWLPPCTEFLFSV